MAIWSVSLGIASLIAWIIPIVGFPVCLASMILGSIALAKKRNRVASAIAIFCGVLGMLLSILNGVFAWILESTQFWQSIVY